MALSSLTLARKEGKEITTGKDQVLRARCVVTMTLGHNPEKRHSRYLKEYICCDGMND